MISGRQTVLFLVVVGILIIWLTSCNLPTIDMLPNIIQGSAKELVPDCEQSSASYTHPRLVLNKTVTFLHNPEILATNPNASYHDRAF